jgi:negative regulator of flagellin synthesis FlgM
MSVEIGQLSSIQAIAPQERVSRNTGDVGTTRETTTTKGMADEVKLSSSALKIQEAERRLALEPDIDQVRVAAIRDALDAVTYQVHAGQVADGLMAQDRQFLARQGQ